MSSPGYSWDSCMLNDASEIEPNKKSWYARYQREKQTRWLRLCIIQTKWNANNHYLPDYDESQDENYFQTTEHAKNLYAWAMTQALP